MTTYTIYTTATRKIQLYSKSFEQMVEAVGKWVDEGEDLNIYTILNNATKQKWTLTDWWENGKK